jgi:hypothetical protein
MVNKTEIEPSERTARAASSARNRSTTVELHDLGEKDPTGMRWEVRIVHPERSPATTTAIEAIQAPEVFRFLDEESARAAFELYVGVLSPPSKE